MKDEHYAIIYEYPILDGETRECLACGKKLKQGEAFLISAFGNLYGAACAKCRDKALEELGGEPIVWCKDLENGGKTE